ncbi:MAG: hypothetical protein Q9213_005524 [Squamulea squamosa]
MSLPYGFTSPDKAQLQRRRQLLDAYGQLAQLSALLVLFAYQFFFVIRCLLHKICSSPDDYGKEHASPVVSRFGERILESSPNENSKWRRVEWFLDQDVSWGAKYPSWGTRRVLLLASVWTIWLFILAIKDTGDDYLHLTKRFGIIGASQLPLHYLLALKSSWSPISYLTCLSHEELNPYHRALGRIVLLFLSLHASFYLNFFIQKSLLAKRIRDLDVQLGLLAITILLTLGTTALAWVRKKNYFLFFLIHVTTSIAILPILYFHVSHLRIYILESALIYTLLIVQRNISLTKLPSATLTHLNSNLLSITIPFTPLSLSKKKTFHPGQHIYLTPPNQRLRFNPFTIANLPQKDKHIRLILRTLNGTTRMLAANIPPTTSRKTTIPLSIEGPYGSAATFPDFLKYDRVLLVAGGVGATFTMPIYRDLVDRGMDLKRMKFVWSVKSVRDALWAGEYLNERDVVGVEIYDTGAGAESGERDEGVELQERAGLLRSDGEGSSTSSSEETQRLDLLPNLKIAQGRPNISAIVKGCFAARTGEAPPMKVAVLVCGPAGMGAAVRREVGVWIGRGGREVWWHNEAFGW